MEIVGYCDPLSVAPGDRVRFMVSAQGAYDVSFARLAGAGGPARLESGVDGTHEGRPQSLAPGSSVVVEDAPPLEPTGAFALEAWIWPTSPGGHPQIVAGQHDGVNGYAIGIDDFGHAALWLDGEVVATSEPVRGRAWYKLEGSYDAASRWARIVQTPAEEWPGAAAVEEGEREVGGWTASTVPFRLAAWGAQAAAHFNGKIEAPRLCGADGTVVAQWSLGGDHASDWVEDVSGGGRHGRCRNLPMRAVTSRTWRGGTTDPSLAPDEYAAIWFHDDDLADAGWEPSFELDVPEDTASGVYALRLSTEDADDEVPFFVRPARATADIVVLMPTLSYLAYGNEHNSWANPIPSTPGLDGILASVTDRDRYVVEERLKSIYELHSDGSGVAYSSRLRPIANMRSDYGMPLLLGGPHQFPADLELLEWLDRRGFHYDVITDEDIHHRGSEIVRPYRVLVTGSHPEYWTEAMLDTLEAWLAGGGRLMYMGGNGFYWVTSLFAEHPHVIEVRRGHAGTGVWRSDPGEVHHASTGELGGLWRFRGRAPQRLAGVGFTAQGFDHSRPYRRSDESHREDVAWIFDGVEGAQFGAHGSVLHGAAGFEIDRADQQLGTPPNATVVATAREFSDVYQATSEDILTADSQQGGTVSPLVRADMVFFERPNGGAVFSTGSIAWCGALLDEECDNDVSRITENVLRRFAHEGQVNGT